MTVVQEELSEARKEEVARRCFEAFEHAFGEAADSTRDVVRRNAVVAGSALQLTFAGAALDAALYPAFAHLEGRQRGGPDLRISCWDWDSTGVGMPPLPWRPDDFVALGQLPGYERSPVRPLVEPMVGAVALVDTEGGRAICHYPSARDVPWHERAAPLRAVLHCLLGARERYLMHAGAVSHGSTGAMIVGGSGAGKSTVTLACLEAGLEYVGDDFVAVSSDADGFVAHGLYSTAKMHPERVHLVSSLAGAVVNSDPGQGEKSILDLHAARPERLRLATRINAVVIPRIAGEARPGLQPASAAAALLALAPSTVLMLPGQDRKALEVSASIATAVPSYFAELGSPTEVATAIEAVLARAG